MRLDPEMERLEANLRDALKPFIGKPDAQLWKALRAGKMAAGFCGVGSCPEKGEPGPGGVFCPKHAGDCPEHDPDLPNNLEPTA